MDSGSVEVVSGVIQCCWAEMLKMMTVFLQNKLDIILFFVVVANDIVVGKSVFPRTLIFI